jgi:hypothetical protein
VAVRIRLLFISLFLLVLAPRQMLCQQPNHPLDNPPPGAHENPMNDTESAEKLNKAMQKRLNEERQAQLKRDTDKLLDLSTQLKQYVDKTNQNVLSVDVIKKADEIEKLAHSVKEKMKGN